MSHQRVSKDLHNDLTLTSGGRDCKTELRLRLQGPDLWVKGGALVENYKRYKNQCALFA